MRLPIECRKHKITYDAWDAHCPECQKEYDAGDRILRRLTCQLCDELKGSTKMYCGGPVSFVCDDCKRILDKYHKLKEKHEAFWENMKKVRSLEETQEWITLQMGGAV